MVIQRLVFSVKKQKMVTVFGIVNYQK